MTTKETLMDGAYKLKEGAILSDSLKVIPNSDTIKMYSDELAISIKKMIEFSPELGNAWSRDQLDSEFAGLDTDNVRPIFRVGATRDEIRQKKSDKEAFTVFAVRCEGTDRWGLIATRDETLRGTKGQSDMVVGASFDDIRYGVNETMFKMGLPMARQAITNVDHRMHDHTQTKISRVQTPTSSRRPTSEISIPSLLGETESRGVTTTEAILQSGVDGITIFLPTDKNARSGILTV